MYNFNFPEGVRGVKFSLSLSIYIHALECNLRLTVTIQTFSHHNSGASGSASYPPEHGRQLWRKSSAWGDSKHGTPPPIRAAPSDRRTRHSNRCFRQRNVSPAMIVLPWECCGEALTDVVKRIWIKWVSMKPLTSQSHQPWLWLCSSFSRTRTHTKKKNVGNVLCVLLKLLHLLALFLTWAAQWPENENANLGGICEQICTRNALRWAPACPSLPCHGHFTLQSEWSRIPN